MGRILPSPWNFAIEILRIFIEVLRRARGSVKNPVRADSFYGFPQPPASDTIVLKIP
jgi:hypothetical protein